MVQNDSTLHVSVLQSGLQARAILPALPAAARPWTLIFLHSGALSIGLTDADAQSEPLEFQAPVVVCWPATPRRQVQMQAGSSGVGLAVGDGFVSSAIGRRPEALELREMTHRFATLALDALPQEADRIALLLDDIAREHQTGAAGQLLLIEAQLRCLLIHLWRHTHRTDETPVAQGPQTMLLRAFRQLVETHHRARWRVQDYAEALNTTPDRLHNIATQTLGRTPLSLIHERAHIEARLLLTRTNMSLDQIAAHLNFKTTPQFSTFFRKYEGIPPGAYRASAPRSRQDAAQDGVGEICDWP